MTQARRIWILASLAVIASVYAVIATDQTVGLRSSLVLHSASSFPLRLLAGPFWYAALLIPITIVSTILGLKLETVAGIVTVSEMVMIFVWYHVTGFWRVDLRTGTIVPEFIGAIINLALQIPVWGITRLVIRAVRRA